MRLSSVEYVVDNLIDEQVIGAILSGAEKGHLIRIADSANKHRQTHHSEVN